MICSSHKTHTESQRRLKNGQILRKRFHATWWRTGGVSELIPTLKTWRRAFKSEMKMVFSQEVCLRGFRPTRKA